MVGMNPGFYTVMNPVVQAEPPASAQTATTQELPAPSASSVPAVAAPSLGADVASPSLSASQGQASALTLPESDAFARIDLDGDGFLTRAELEAYNESKVSVASLGDPVLEERLRHGLVDVRTSLALDRYDADGDERISLQEYGQPVPIDQAVDRAYLRRQEDFFVAADLDADGFVTRHEAETKYGGMTTGGIGGLLIHDIMRADADGDGRVSRAEQMAVPPSDAMLMSIRQSLENFKL